MAANLYCVIITIWLYNKEKYYKKLLGKKKLKCDQLLLLLLNFRVSKMIYLRNYVHTT
jgi:hypothetical protein